MKDFFQIVPLLFANMVDNKLLHKGKLLRRGHEVKNSIWTYDSFLLGVAFVLKVTLFFCMLDLVCFTLPELSTHVFWLSTFHWDILF
jgi:hypothetical protein